MTEDTKQLESLSYRPAKSSPATSGFNSAVIRPETKVNKVKDAGQLLEQPNLKIIKQAEGATKVILELLNQLEPCNTDQRGDVQGCIWTLEGWLKNNLNHLNKTFED